MYNLLPEGIPPIEETRHTRESLIEALTNQRALPSIEIAAGTLYADIIEPDILAVLERAHRETLDWPSERLLFRGLHILGGRRVPSAYRPLIVFLRGPQSRVEALLGDAVTETLSRILAGLFDGDAEPLLTLIADREVEAFVRNAALQAVGFHVAEGRIDRASFEAFLARFDDGRFLSPDEDIMWHGWMTTVGVLGVTGLAPRVRAAFADGRISPDFAEVRHFEALLKGAREHPNDRTRLDREQMGYLEDVLAALEQFTEHDSSFARDDGLHENERADESPLRWAGPQEPVRNPFRGVGRNDPCPCGSGEKAKRCCLRPQ